MSRFNVVAVLFFIAVLGVGGYFFYAPYLAMHNLQRAAKTGDVAQLDASVDFPALRQNIKEQLQHRIESSVSKTRGSALASVASAFGATLINPMVELLVTPQAIAAMINGAKMAPDSTLNAVSPPQALATTAGPDASAPAIPAARTPHGYVMGYVNANRFQIAPSRDGVTADTPRLILERRGLGWKLTGIDLGFAP